MTLYQNISVLLVNTLGLSDNKIMICKMFQMHGAHKPRDWEQGSAK